MGGSIKVTVRFAEDRVESQMRWTNTLPYHFRTPKIINDPVQHWRDYLDTPSEYREEGENVVAPDGYGLVVVDFVTMTVAHANGYSGLVDRVPSTAVMDSEDLADLQWFIDNKRARLNMVDIVGQKAVTTFTPFQSIDEMETLVAARRPAYFDMLEYDITPWSVLSFDDDAKGMSGLKGWLINAGFAIDEVAWKSWRE